MTLNKSTPSSRNGFLKEITGSTGKTTNFLLPVRIKVTPQHSTFAPLSDGKKDYTKMMQPVLIKDLLESAQKSKSTTVTSVSTQKKKQFQMQKSVQPFLNVQSCYKAKEDKESSFLGRKSCAGNKVRRQLYQNLDTPQRLTLDGKENAIKSVKTKLVKSSRDCEVPRVKCSQNLNKSTKGFLLPPNSIRNSFIKKSGNFRLLHDDGVKTNACTISKPSKDVSCITNSNLQKNNFKQNILKVDDTNTKMNFSSADADKCTRKESCVMQDLHMMTSSIHEETTLSKSSINLSKLDRPSVIVTSKTKNLKNSLEMQNLNTNQTSHIQCPEFELAQINFSDINNMIQCKTFLEQSIKACEDQVFRLKHILNFVNTLLIHTKTIYSNKTFETQLMTDEHLKSNENYDISSNIILNSQDWSDATKTFEKNLEMKEIIDGVNSKPEIKVHIDEEENQTRKTEKLPISMRILVTDTDLHEEIKEASDVLSELAYLSTIGEVSYEVEELTKDERTRKNKLKNNKNVDGISQMLLTPTNSSKILQESHCKSVIPESDEQRQSSRLAAQHRSLSMTLDTDFDKQDSFTLLENELNVIHEVKVPSKSLPASPMKVSTPNCIRQWDKRVERPLKEYMALKMNGTFLVTPDVKKFQSCLEPTDTPHSRKSLSRKIFMELCDLYAESPQLK